VAGVSPAIPNSRGRHGRLYRKILIRNIFSASLSQWRAKLRDTKVKDSQSPSIWITQGHTWKAELCDA
jgi:hypothetical protein